MSYENEQSLFRRLLEEVTINAKDENNIAEKLLRSDTEHDVVYDTSDPEVTEFTIAE